MDRDRFIQICNLNLKQVRIEFSFSQDKMAIILGISKKTLVEIEKGRSSLRWSGSVVLCSLFGKSRVLSDIFGEKLREIMSAIAFEGVEPEYPQATGGKILWKTVKESGKYVIEQNIITQHYRLLNSEGKRVASSLDLEDLIEIFSDES